MPVWVSLLRAVNLGSHNKVSMPAPTVFWALVFPRFTVTPADALA